MNRTGAHTDSLARGESSIETMTTYPFVYRFKPNNGKYKDLFGQRCRVLARGALNSALVEFESGEREVVSRNALRKVNDQ